MDKWRIKPVRSLADLPGERYVDFFAGNITYEGKDYWVCHVDLGPYRVSAWPSLRKLYCERRWGSHHYKVVPKDDAGGDNIKGE